MSPLLPRALRVLGYALCVIMLAPEIVGRVTEGFSPHGTTWQAWYAVFVAGFLAGAGSPGRSRSWAAIALQEGAMLGMALAAPCQFATIALAIVALQLALVLKPWPLTGALLAQTGVISVLVMQGCGAWESVSWLLAMGGFQAAIAVAVVLALREGEARGDLVRTNAELRAARTLLAEAARVEERGRIARELHDVLGHHLTALGLQLEVAKNVSAEKAPDHVAKARVLADEALAGVREAVSAMRENARPDVAGALRQLCADTPGLAVHLELPEPFAVAGSAQAHCLVRCIQEILTNTLRHAEAKNLWIRVGSTAALLTVDARDDGRGATELRAGNGLAGMRSRIEEMGGRLAIAVTPAFSLSAQLPMGGEP